MGVAAGILFMPRRFSRARHRAFFIAGCAALALAPDWPLPGWGHSSHGHYRISHSYFVNLALMAPAAAALALWPGLRQKTGGWPAAAGGALAWLSHPFLDSLYAHGMGLRVLWPFYHSRLALPVPWFGNIEAIPPPLNWHTAQVCAVELLFYLPLAGLALGYRLWRGRRRGKANRA